MKAARSQHATHRYESLGIDPEASLIKIAEHEITNDRSLHFSAVTPAVATAVVSASATLNYGDKSTFAGNGLIHGFDLWLQGNTADV